MPPTIEGPEREVIVETVSNPVTLTCDATGIPPPTITWLKNHKPIGNTLEHFCGCLILPLIYYIYKIADFQIVLMAAVCSRKPNILKYKLIKWIPD